MPSLMNFRDTLDWDITPVTTLSVAYASQSDETKALSPACPPTQALSTGPIRLFGREHQATVGYNRERLRYANKWVTSAATAIPFWPSGSRPGFQPALQ
jgi:outer membrane receptor for ferric coprogen and ferric-rhodotorulic acid